MIEIITGDCVNVMNALPAKSIQTCITSPPYFGQRDYENKEQYGQETTAEEYVDNMVMVFRAVRRVLRDDGTLWLNLGDSYVKKNLQGIPWRVAIALQEDGWILRNDIIWNKPNPKPESVRDRCTTAHEYIFLLVKNKSYFYDKSAIDEPAVYAGQSRGGSQNRYAENSAGMDNKIYDMRNKRTVWTVKPTSLSGAHFAVYPEELIEPCVLAGTDTGGVVLDPFAGSGTTGIVAEKNGRDSVMIELNPKYVKIMEQRTEESQLKLFR